MQRLRFGPSQHATPATAQRPQTSRFGRGSGCRCLLSLRLAISSPRNDAGCRSAQFQPTSINLTATENFQNMLNTCSGSASQVKNRVGVPMPHGYLTEEDKANLLNLLGRRPVNRKAPRSPQQKRKQEI